MRGPMFQPSSGLMPDPADFSRPDDEACVFGDPPDAMLRAHHRPFVNEFWRRMVRAIEDPVEVDARLGIRRVQVLGQAIYTWLPDGTVSVQLWHSPRSGPTRRVLVPAYGVAASHTPHGDRWLDMFRAGFEFEAFRMTRAPWDTISAHADWLFPRIRRRVRHDCDLRRMRRTVALALAFDPRVVAIARRLPQERRPDGVLTLHDYNAAVLHRARRREARGSGADEPR